MAAAVPPTTPIVLSNPNTPIPGVMMDGNAPGIPLGTLCDTPMPSSPPTGYLWRAKSATGRAVISPQKGVHALLFYVQPSRGDGGKVQFLPKAPRLNSSVSFGGGAGAEPPGDYNWQQWTDEFLLTPHMEVMFAQFMQPADKTYFAETFDQFPMGPGQSEVYFETAGGGFDGPCSPGDQRDRAYDLGSVCDPVVPASTVPPGTEWVPGAWEINVSTGATAGSRHARIVAVPPGVSPTKGPVAPSFPISTTAPVWLARTGEITATGRMNNNATGSWTPEGTAPQDQKGSHVVFRPASRYRPATRSMW